MIDEREKLLLRLLFSEEMYTENNAALLFDGLDLANEHLEYPLMLAILGSRKGWKYFPESFRPRLEGILRATRLKNIYAVPWLREKMALLQEHGIAMMLLKGMAMRAYYAPEYPRQMSDIDLAVPEECFEEAKKLLTESEPELVTRVKSLHAQHLSEDEIRTIDLHHWIFKSSAGTDKMWQNAVPVCFQSIDLLVPDPADMCIHIVDSKARDVITNIQSERRMKWLFDLRCIISKAEGWNWEAVAARADELGSLLYLKYLLPEFSDVFPDMLSPEELHRSFPQDRSFLKWKKDTEKVIPAEEALKDYIRQHGVADYSLRRTWLSVRSSWIRYHCYIGPDLKKAGIKTSFLKYYCSLRHADSLGQLIKKRLNRDYS